MVIGKHVGNPLYPVALHSMTTCHNIVLMKRNVEKHSKNGFKWPIYD
jgi:hypothetical protein